jgi:hypothetical protein
MLQEDSRMKVTPFFFRIIQASILSLKYFAKMFSENVLNSEGVE